MVDGCAAIAAWTRMRAAPPVCIGCAKTGIFRFGHVGVHEEDVNEISFLGVRAV